MADMTGDKWFSFRATTIVDHILTYEGYTQAQIDEAKETTHKSAGCEFDTNTLSWECEDEYGRSNHPVLDEWNVVAELVRLTLEENDRLVA